MFGCVDWMHLAQDRVQRRVLVNTVIGKEISGLVEGL